MTRYPDYAAAELAACETLLRHGRPLPIRPLELIREVALVISYEEAAERLGLTAEAFERGCGQAEAFTVREGERSLVCCRMDGNPARLNFTLAHELGHILLGHAGGPADEREADHFASCLLMPEPVRRRLASRPELSAEDAARLCYLSVAAAQACMRRRPTELPRERMDALDALFASQTEALKPAPGKALRRPLNRP